MEEMYKAIMKGKKRGKGDMDENEMKSKLGVLQDIHKMAQDDLGHDIHGLKKVSVMSDSDEGMKEGLKKAGELAAHKQGFSHSDDDANDVSDDMHAESRRHKVAKHSEMNDEEDGMADSHGDEPQKGKKAMEGYADGGMIHSGQYGEDEADVHGAEHQHDQTHEFMENGPEEMKKEWDPGRNYANGGMIHSGAFGEDEADAHGAEKQHFERHGIDSRAAMPTIGKEAHSSNPHLMGSGKDEHNNRPHAAENVDDYGDLDDSDIEALIKHLMAKRKG